MSLPFDSYPSDALKQPIWGSNCRRGYGLKYIELTHQRRCAYCEDDLLDPFEIWLTMVLDHVVPVSVCKKLGINDTRWYWSLANAVLSCGACNGFCNRYAAPPDTVCPDTFEGFIRLRNEIFLKRKEIIAKRRVDEKAFWREKVAKLARDCPSVQITNG